MSSKALSFPFENCLVREDTSRRGYAGLGLKRTLNPEDAGSVLLAVGR